MRQIISLHIVVSHQDVAISLLFVSSRERGQAKHIMTSSLERLAILDQHKNQARSEESLFQHTRNNLLSFEEG